MRVLKFGGSSLASPERVRKVAALVAEARARGPLAVVVSAFGGVTDELLAAARDAARGDDAWRRRWRELAERHRAAAEELARDEAPELAGERLLGELNDLLHGISLVREVSPRTLDAVLAHGERLSAPLVAAAISAAGAPAAACDACRLIVTDSSFGSAAVDLEATRRRLREHFSAAHDASGDDVAPAPVQVIPGFVAASADGETTTLGRGGSDYTAAIVGACLGAEAVELWTDVDGVMSADPRIVDDAAVIERLSYVELMELSHFGAKVVHPPSVHPTRAAGIPLAIRNTFNPRAPGTLVDAEGAAGGDAPPVRGIPSIRRIALLRLEGDGMVGVPGIASRLFGALARERVNVVLITQASSEHSISFGIAPEAVAAAARALATEFELERRAGLIDELVIEDDVSVVAAVGTGMRDRPGIAGRLFGALAEAGVNVRAVAQGSSELNISVVVALADEARAVRALHRRFFAPRRHVEVHLLGAGRVGGALLGQLARRAGALAAERGIELRLAALATRRGVLAAAEGLDPGRAAGELERRLASGETLPKTAEHLAELARRPRTAVVVDCTASAETGRAYASLLAAGIAVVSANKLPFATRLAELPPRGALYHEATVGAGLPVVGPLRDLVAAGDRLLAVEGVLSGTLAFVLDRLQRGERFSAALREAFDRGLTEPDPREDLAGGDVARKLLILARLGGFALEPEAVEIEPLLPRAEGWEELELDDFWRRLPELDARFAERRERAAGRRLVYLARFDGERARVGLEALPLAHPAAALTGTENLVLLRTALYDQTPLVVRGPGAGPEVTAAGVFADLLRAAGEQRAP